MCNPWTLLKNNADPIMVLVTIAGFGLTIWQLKEAGNALRASNSYEIQKDSRELVQSLLTDAEFRGFVKGTAEISPGAQDKLWIILSFYRSIYRQSEAGGLVEEYAQAIREEFCEFVNQPPISDGWKKLLTDKRIGEGHEEMRAKWCAGR